MTRKLWILYGLSVFAGFTALPGRMLIGKAGFVLVLISVGYTVYISFFSKREDGRSSMLAIWVNVAGLTLGAVFGFVTLALLSERFLLGTGNPERSGFLALKWLGYSTVLHLGTGYLVWRSKQPVQEPDLPTPPEIPEDVESLSDEEKQRIKQEMEEFLGSASAEIERINRKMKQRMVLALLCIGGGAVLMTWPFWRHMVGR